MIYWTGGHCAMISQQTPLDIALAYCEVEVAQKLLDEISARLAHRRAMIVALSEKAWLELDGAEARLARQLKESNGIDAMPTTRRTTNV